MATIKSFTDISQSRTLSKILPPESADMWYWEWPTAPRYNNYKRPMPHKGEDIVNVPCWSLAALLGVLPKIHGLKPILDLEECSIQYSGIDLYIVASNPIDACYETILKLHELNLL